ncbi:MULTISPECIES: hypothetical protein [unclassified Streptomyces]|uniref:hypothetical protein n=1 Tax=unclassified Streptomyces TaxID=2593676 RepID=UPI000883F32C|nr:MULTISPECIES: hypothetical protein [unclassified Streptomyces]PBC72304.1 hypothetical protein BX261_7388 [Streptomyces sp. 2321.6]SDR62234.1 hypothetical protein SAMN05216511_7315 [Streptomyces sp. KS_16]SEE51243.1 hypothetical protein SAMN05428940_7364 [Streptomyces sp. 2133.1]SNC77808.1 hypothetical protein SAMN06272741_7224 [Streptomyces sp. 2114.4]
MAPSPEPQPDRIVLNDATIWPTIAETPRRQQLCDWLTANGIDYQNVAVPDPLTVETVPDGQRIIRHTVYLLTDDGYRYTDPNDPNQAAREERTAPLLVEPPAEEQQ